MYWFALISGIVCAIAGVAAVAKAFVTFISEMFDCTDDDDNNIDIDDDDNDQQQRTTCI